MAANPTPLERDEQRRVVQWCEDRGLKFSSIPNSTYTTSHRQKMLNRITGLRPGLPDLLVLIAPHQSRDGRGYMLMVEMKRPRGGKVTEEQRAWIAAINGLGCDQIESVVAHGADEAIEYLSGYLNEKTLKSAAVLF